MGILKATLVTILALFIFAGCEDDQETNLFKAQQCIDTANSTTVTECSSILGSDSSEQSYILRCAIAFIAEDITEVQIVDALENVDNTASTSDPTIAAFSALAMKDSATSTAALNDCTLSGSKALIALANLANLATATASLAGILSDPSEAAIQNFLDNYNSSTDAAVLGAAVIASQDSICNAENGLMKGTETCDSINAAVASGNADSVGDALIANIQAPNP